MWKQYGNKNERDRILTENDFNNYIPSLLDHFFALHYANVNVIKHKALMQIRLANIQRHTHTHTHMQRRVHCTFICLSLLCPKHSKNKHGGIKWYVLDLADGTH